MGGDFYKLRALRVLRRKYAAALDGYADGARGAGKLIKCVDRLFIRIFSQQQPNVLPPRGADAFRIALHTGQKLPGLQERMTDLVVNVCLGAQDLLFPRRLLHILPILPKPPVHAFQAKVVLFHFPLEPRFLGDIRAGDLVNTVVTDKNGVAKSDTLPLGRYTIRETKAPVFYSATTQPIEVEIEFSGQIVRVEVLNQSVYTNVSVTKRGYKQVTPSQTIRYDFKNIANNSTVPLNSFYWRDTLPTSAVRLTKIITGTWNQRLSYKVVYKTNLHDYRTLADNLSTMKNYSLDASPAALGLASNEYVTDFMFVFGTVKAGFAQVDAPYILCWTNSWLNNGYQFANRTDVGGLHGGQWIMATDRWVTTVYKPGVTTLPKTGY